MKTLLLIYALLSISNVYAFRLITNTSATFSSKEVKFHVTSNSTCSNAGISNTELLSIAEDAVNSYWNKVPSSSLRLKKGSIYNTTDALYLTGELCASDSVSSCDPATTVPTAGDIIIACNSNTTNFPNSAYLAISAPNNVSGSKITGAVVLINDTPTTAFAGLSYAEKRSVLAHELGHAVGLGHSNRNYALMYYQNSDKLFRLSQDDIDGITYLYPNQVIDSCSGILGSLDLKNDPPAGGKGALPQLKINKIFLFNMAIAPTIGFLILMIAKFFTILRFKLDNHSVVK